MSNPLSQARSDVAEALSSIPGVQVYDYIPKTLTAPLSAVILPGSPYVAPGQRFGEYEVTLTVRLSARTNENGKNEVVSKSLDGLIVAAIDALYEFGYVTASTTGRDTKTSDSLVFLVSEITVKTTYRKDLNG